MEKVSYVKLNNTGVTYSLDDVFAAKTEELNARIAELTSMIEALTSRVSALEYDQYENNNDDSSSSYEYHFDDDLVKIIRLTNVVSGNTSLSGDRSVINVEVGQPISMTWEVLPATAANKEVVIVSNNNEVVVTDDNTIAAISTPGEYEIYLKAKDGSLVQKRVRIVVE